MYIIINDATEWKKFRLCSYFYKKGDKYRLIGTSECRNIEPNHTSVHNDKLFLYKCETNYHIVDNKYKPEYFLERCEICTEISNNINEQKCSSCKSNYIYDTENKNCILPPTTIPNLSPTTIHILSPTTIIENKPTTIIIDTPITNVLIKNVENVIEKVMKLNYAYLVMKLYIEK